MKSNTHFGKHVHKKLKDQNVCYNSYYTGKGDII